MPGQRRIFQSLPVVNSRGVIVIVTEEKFQIAREVERMAVSYGIPRDELLKLVRLGFEAGQRDGLTSYATAVTNALHSRVA